MTIALIVVAMVIFLLGLLTPVSVLYTLPISILLLIAAIYKERYKK